MAEKKYQLNEIQKLEDHTDKVCCLAWNPVSGTDGKPVILASCSADKTLRIWRRNPLTAVFEPLKTFRGAHAGTGRSCSWSPDGVLLAIPSYDGITYLWDMIDDDFKEILEYDDIHDPEVDKEVIGVSWDPSGGDLATCSRASVRIWQRLMYPDFQLDYEFKEPKKDVEMVQFHPLEYILFSCGCDDIIKIWAKHDHEQWYHAQTLNHASRGHSSKVCSISFNATGDKMVTSSEDLSIRVWGEEGEPSDSDDDYVLWEHLYTITGYHKRTIFSVHWSSEGIIASGAADGAICLFVENQDGLKEVILLKSKGRREDMYKLLLTKEKAHETDVNSVQQGPKDKSTDKCKSLLTKKARDTEVTAVQWGPKEIKLLASSSDNGTIKIWELTSCQ